MRIPESITVEVRHEEGQLWATVKELPGVFASGFTEDELAESLTEGLSLYLSTPDHPVQLVLISEDENEAPDRVEERNVRLCPA